MPHQSALRYSIAVTSIADHLITVKCNIPKHAKPSLSLTLPAWIPGSYMIRDFAKSIIEFSATSEQGEPVNWRKTDKQTWEVETSGQAIEVCYLVHANDLSVRSAFINDQYAFLNGTSVFLCDPSLKSLNCEVIFERQSIPTQWSIHTSLGDEERGYVAKNYEELIDHPIFIGVCQTEKFMVSGVDFTLLFSGNDPIDISRIAKDLVPICEHHLRMFKDTPPISDYLFMTLLSDKGYGGLEHRNSTALLFPRFDLPLLNEGANKTDSYIDFLSLCSHELFHTWHVKRIKPDVMVTPDLSKETYTDQLWIYEGFTSYYDEVTLARVGLIDPQQYCQLLSKTFTRVQQNKGRKRQTISESSFDAWSRFYKQDASATNVIVSYYAKGGIVALGLDLLLRNASEGTYDLDDLMRLLWSHYGADESGTPWNVIQTLCLEHFQVDVSRYLSDVVYGTQDVDLQALLPVAGLAIDYRQQQSLNDKGGELNSIMPRNGLGLTVATHVKGLEVKVIREDTAASQAGLMVADVIVAVEDYEVTTSLFERFVHSNQSNPVKLSVLREGRLIVLYLPVLEAAEDVCRVFVKDADICRQWLASWNQ